MGFQLSASDGGGGGDMVIRLASGQGANIGENLT